MVALSFSGMGASGWRTQYSVAQWADEALAVAETTGLFAAAMPPAVAAHSFGGFPLMKLAACHEQQLARAAIIDTPLRPPSGLGQRGSHRRHRPHGLRSARVCATLAEPQQRFRLLPPQGCAYPFITDLIARRGLKQTMGPTGQPAWVWRFDPFIFAHFDFARPYRDLGLAHCPLPGDAGARRPFASAHAGFAAPRYDAGARRQPAPGSAGCRPPCDDRPAAGLCAHAGACARR